MRKRFMFTTYVPRRSIQRPTSASVHQRVLVRLHSGDPSSSRETTSTGRYLGLEMLEGIAPPRPIIIITTRKRITSQRFSGR